MLLAFVCQLKRGFVRDEVAAAEQLGQGLAD
jgi:hypothetical protein